MAANDVSNTLKSLTSGEGNAMGNLLKSGDVGKATQMAYAVLSMVDKSEGSIDASDRQSVCFMEDLENLLNKYQLCTHITTI
jgi:hypothetical protein